MYPQSYSLYEPFTVKTSNLFNETWYNDKKKEKLFMSSMAVLRLGDSYIIASDSHSTECNFETNRQYQKIFPFKNGVFGVVGANNIVAKGENINIGNFIQNSIDELTSPKLFAYMTDFYNTYGRFYHNNIELVFIFAENNTLHHEFYSIKDDCFIHYDFIELPIKDIKFYAQNYINFPKGNSEFMQEINRNPEATMKRVIRYNEDVHLFTENKRYIGGPVQMYKVFIDGVVKNLSEAPFH